MQHYVVIVLQNLSFIKFPSLIISDILSDMKHKNDVADIDLFFSLEKL